jgi:hypothetical protein
MNPYGLPLDSRRDYTKLDWEIWTASLTGNKADLETMASPIYEWMNATSSRVPLTDWYDTKDGKQQNFKARSVVGGVFIPMLKDVSLWTKWAQRDKNKPSEWAPMPSRPSYKEVVATGEKTDGIEWKYTVDAPTGDWFATNYDTKSWKTGQAGFGSEGTPAINIRTPWISKDLWLRRTFTFASPLPAAAQIYGFHDDAIDLYLNGKLVGNLGGYNAAYEAIASIPNGLLKQGENVLAAHVHQDGGPRNIGRS